MALTVSNANNNNSTSSGATLTVGSINASVGDWLVVMVASDNNGTNGAASLSTSMTDNAAGGSNTYTNRGGLINQDPGAAAAGATFSMWTCKVTTALSGGTITANFSPNTTSKAITVYRVQPGTDEVIDFVAVGSGGTGSGTTQTGANAVSVTSGDTIFAGSAVEANATVTGDSDTTNGSWSTAYQAVANTGTTGTSMTATAQWKTVSSTGNQTWTTTTAGSRDWAANYLILRAISQPGAPTYSYWDGVTKGAATLLTANALTATRIAGATNFANARSKHFFSAGKIYVSFLLDDVGAAVGCGNASFPWAADTGSAWVGNVDSFAWWPSDGIYVAQTRVQIWNVSPSNGGRIDMAVDRDNNRAWWRYNNGNWNNGANDPAANTGGVDVSGITGTLYAGVTHNATGDQVTANFGATSHTNTPPIGFESLGEFRRQLMVHRSAAVMRASVY